MGSTPVMLAAKNGYKDIVLILTSEGANLDQVNKVSVHVHTLYYNFKGLELIYIYIYIYI